MALQFLSLLFVLAGLFALAIAIVRFRKAKRARTWPNTSGTILEEYGYLWSSSDQRS